MDKYIKDCLCQLCDSIAKINNTLNSILTEGIGSERKPVNHIYTKNIKIGRNSIRIDNDHIKFDNTGRKITGRRVGDELKPFEEIHSSEIHAEKVGTLLDPVNTIHSSEIYAEKVGTLEKPVQSVVSDLIGVKEIGVDTKMVAKLIEAEEIVALKIGAEEIVVQEGNAEIKNIIAENITADNVTAPNFDGVATRASGIHYISASEPTDPKEGDFWLDIATALNPVLKIRYGEGWRTVANL